MLTCWQASMSWPVAASWKEPARPPTRPRASSTVISKPWGANAVAVASPANPPPMIRTRGMPSRPSPARRHGLYNEPQLVPTAEPYAAAKDVVVAPFDGVKQSFIRAHHDLEH